MTNAWRQWSFTIGALVTLLVLTGIGNTWLTLAACVAMIAFGFVVLPHQRIRGALAAVIALGAAAILALVLRSLS